MNQDQAYSEFILQMHRLFHVNLNFYKEKQMKRRIIHFYQKYGFRDFAQFAHALERDKALADEFMQRITINVTEFFRNPQRWDALLRMLARRGPQDGQLTAWSAACSTGEEPYTLAMLCERLGYRGYRIRATDIDQQVLAKAERGIYGESSLRSVPANLRQHFFTLTDAGYRFERGKLCGQVLFQRHDLLKDPVQDSFDLILCRNVAIYFTDEAKEMLYAKLSNALRTGGILFVGSTEQIFYAERYSLRSVEPFFYQKLG